jgi:hypothetical protein
LQLKVYFYKYVHYLNILDCIEYEK